MAKIILIASSETAYGVQRHLMEEYAVHLRDLGHEAIVLAFDTDSTLGPIAEELGAQDTDLVLSFNSILLDLCISGTTENIFSHLNIPYCSYLLDHPAYHLQRLNHVYDSLTVACVDASHVPFVEKVFSHKAFYLPHAACSVKDEEIPLLERPMKIFFAGTYVDPLVHLKTFKNLGPDMQDVLGCILERAEHLPADPLMDIILEEMQAYVEDEGWSEIDYCDSVFSPLDRFIRCSRRIKVLDVLTRAGIEVVLCGEGWGKSPFARHHKILQAVPYDVVMNKMLGQAQIVMNILPNYIEGSHERLLTGMLGGGIGLTDANCFSDKHFKDGEELLAFRRDDLEALPDRLMDLLDNPKRMRDMALAGQAKVKSEHTWKHRMESLLEHFGFKS